MTDTTDRDRQIQTWAILVLGAFGILAFYCLGILIGTVSPLDLPWQPEGLR